MTVNSKKKLKVDAIGLRIGLPMKNIDRINNNKVEQAIIPFLSYNLNSEMILCIWTPKQ